MNLVTTTLLNLMRIEVLFGVGLVLWAFSIEAKSQELVEFNNGEVADAADINANFQNLKAEIANNSSKMNVYSDGKLLGQLMPELSPFTDGNGYVIKTSSDFLIPLAFGYDTATEAESAIGGVLFTEADCTGDAFVAFSFGLPKSSAYSGVIGHDKLLGWYSASFADVATNIVIQSSSTGSCRESSTDYTSERLLRVMINSEESTGISLPVGEDDTLENIELKYE
jgi:hypothetical protein